ncbi:MAG: deoxyribose-phosphate aldolase [Candidatus Asgardarchaeia archaeon]
MKFTREELAKKLDQTLLEPYTSEKEMEAFCEEAKKYGFASVAILPVHVPIAARVLEGSDVKVTAAIAFPLGSLPTELKVSEVEWCIENGADEVDMVMNIGALKSGKYDVVKKDIEEVVKAAKGKIVKVILEVPLLTRDEVIKACEIVKETGAHYVKTSTGFKGFKGWRPTTVEDVKLLKECVGDKLKVKAAGGIRTAEQAIAIIEAGAERIGTSSGVRIVEGLH